MKSIYAVLAAPEQRIELRERELEPAEDQVLVRILACGICRGDLIEFVRERQTADAFGHEPVGQVVAVGPWVRNLQEGDWVVGGVDGAFATYSLGRERWLYRVPAEMGEAGSLVEPLKCVTTVVRAAAPDYGDAVVVAGCGFMGLGTIAALAGGWQRKLIAVETDASRRQLALEFGATHVIDPTAGDAEEQMRELTGGAGADVVIDFASSQRATSQVARLLKTRGKLVAASGYLPEDQGMELYLRAITVHATPPAFSPDPDGDWHRTIEMMGSRRYPLEKLLTHRFNFSDIQQGFDTSLKGPAVGYLKGIVINDLA
ncbi:MAG: zinc-dependent alcohol dehydrogenase [Armatimonadota bacterium]